MSSWPWRSLRLPLDRSSGPWDLGIWGEVPRGFAFQAGAQHKSDAGDDAAESVCEGLRLFTMLPFQNFRGPFFRTAAFVL